MFLSSKQKPQQFLRLERKGGRKKHVQALRMFLTPASKKKMYICKSKFFFKLFGNSEFIGAFYPEGSSCFQSRL